MANRIAILVGATLILVGGCSALGSSMTDGERVWCDGHTFNRLERANGDAVLVAADRLNIVAPNGKPIDEYWIYDVDENDLPTNSDYVRACKAAYEAR